MKTIKIRVLETIEDANRFTGDEAEAVKEAFSIGYEAEEVVQDGKTVRKAVNRVDLLHPGVYVLPQSQADNLVKLGKGEEHA